MTAVWVVGAIAVALATFVMGLAGFGIALVAMALLPYVMAPADAVVLLTIYAAVFAVVLFVPVRGDFAPRAVGSLALGTIAGTPLGVWALAALPASAMTRLIGLALLAAVAFELAGRLPALLTGRGWGLAAGALAGVIGGAVGTPGPPVVLYATTQGWSPRRFRANVQAFFIVNQGVILAGYWWAGLLTAEVWRYTLAFAVPAVIGVAAGMSLFNRVDAVRFRRIVFWLIGLSGAVMLVRG
ncbi:MAG: sulfite exporter TauE/SafE family protein [Candidatus Rokuibacteriota bacterium]